MSGVKKALQALVAEGLVERIDGKYRLTDRGRATAAVQALELGNTTIVTGCPECPHCIGSGRAGFPLIDPSDPALTTNQPSPRKRKKRA